jgi:hypothetical protein
VEFNIDKKGIRFKNQLLKEREDKPSEKIKELLDKAATKKPPDELDVECKGLMLVEWEDKPPNEIQKLFSRTKNKESPDKISGEFDKGTRGSMKLRKRKRPLQTFV